MHKSIITLLSVAALNCLLSPYNVKAAYDTRWYIGMSSLYCLYGNEYDSTWSGVDEPWVQKSTIELSSGIAEYVEIGKNIHDGKMAIGMSLLHATVDNFAPKITLTSQINAMLLSMEYVIDNEEEISFYLNMGLGFGYASVQGTYNHQTIIPSVVAPDEEAISYVNGNFREVNGLTFAYNFRIGTYLNAGSPLALRIGYQFLGTTNIQSTGNIGAKEQKTKLYADSSLYGQSTMYTSYYNSQLNISAISFKEHILEIGAQYTFWD